MHLLLDIRAAYETATTPIVVSGNIGPRRDGFRPGELMSIAEAGAYHRRQIDTFAGSDPDLIAAFTMSYTAEAVGVTLAARDAGMPVVISFTTETDGKLPSGTPLRPRLTPCRAATRCTT